MEKAAAIQYSQDYPAPIILAAGKGYLAKRIKQGNDFRQRFTRLANVVNRGYEVPEVIEMEITKRLKDWDAGRGSHG